MGNSFGRSGCVIFDKARQSQREQPLKAALIVQDHRYFDPFGENTAPTSMSMKPRRLQLHASLSPLRSEYSWSHYRLQVQQV